MLNFILKWFSSKPTDPEPKIEIDTDAVLAILHPKFHGNNESGVVIGMDNARTIAEDRALIAYYRNWLKTQPRNVVKFW